MTVKFYIKEHECMIDNEDADLLEVQWSVAVRKSSNIGYVVRGMRTPKYIKIMQHRVVLSRMLGRELEKGEEVDHINGNGIDNRRENLRLASGAQNQANRHIQKNNTIGLKGVSRMGKNYQAKITVNRTRHYLGTFSTPEEAHEAYVKAAKKYFGDFARGE